MVYSSSNALQSDRENGEHLESFWSVIVFQEKANQAWETTRKQGR